jgi:hypothetical protein
MPCHIIAIVLQPVSPFGMYASGKKKDVQLLLMFRLLLLLLLPEKSLWRNGATRLFPEHH